MRTTSRCWLSGEGSTRAKIANVRKVNPGQLRTGVVVKQVFIVWIFEQVFIGADRSALAVALLDDGTIGGLGLRRRIAAAGGHGLDQKRFAIGKPLHRVSDDGAELDPFKLLRLGSLNVASPQLNSVS